MGLEVDFELLVGDVVEYDVGGEGLFEEDVVRGYVEGSGGVNLGFV